MNIEQERTDLLPCPFCGESKSLIVQHCEGTIIHPAYRIYCGNCGASSGYADRVDPVKYWNRRAAPQSRDRDALREIANWPNGGKRYGQEKIKDFARRCIEGEGE